MSIQDPDFDPDLFVDEGAFEEFAELVVAAVLGPDVAGAAQGAADGVDAVTDAAESTGSVIAGEGGDALYTLPDGSISFSGSSGFGDSYSYSFDAG